MKLKKWFLTIFCSLSILAGLLGGGSVAAAVQGTQLGTAMVIVDGVQKPLKPGMVIAVGKPVVNAGEKQFQIPNITIQTTSTINTPNTKVVLRIRDNGEVVVDEIVFDSAAPPESVRTSADVLLPEPRLTSQTLQTGSNNMLDSTNYRGYAMQQMLEIAGLPVTEVRVLMSYVDTGYEVSDGYDWYYRGWDYWPHWFVDRVGAEWGPTGPEMVYIACDADFSSWWFDPHWLQVYYKGWPGGVYGTESHFSGTLPGGCSLVTTSGIWVV